MRYILRTHGVSVAWLHEAFKNDVSDVDYELSSRMRADIYTKAFTAAALWVQVCDLINIVDPKRLLGLVQHVAEVVAGLDDVSVIPTQSAGNGTKARPPSGGVTQNGAGSGTKKATPTPSRDATRTLSDSDRTATMTTIMGINHGTRIDFGVNDNPRYEKLINIGSILDTLIGDYNGDNQDFLIIGNDERVLEFVSDTELVLGI
eukprot:5312904-Heterocapsa_arctica.AAC.1